MYARNRMTEAPILGPLEKLEGRSDIVADSFKRDSAGGLEFKHDGNTEVVWNSQRTETGDGHTVFLDENGNAVTADEIELTAERHDSDGDNSTLVDVTTLYELIDGETGQRRGPFTELETADAERRPQEKIRYGVYCITSETGIVNTGEPERDPPQAA